MRKRTKEELKERLAVLQEAKKSVGQLMLDSCQSGFAQSMTKALGDIYREIDRVTDLINKEE